MWRKIALAGATAAVIVGAGGAALATSGTGSTVSGTPSVAGATAAAHPGRPGLRAFGGRLLHGQFVTKGKDGSTYVTHTVIRGDVTAVSSTSITVKAADGVSQTFTVNGNTKVHQRGSGRGTTVDMSAVKTGAAVLVAGTGTNPVTATHIVLGTK